eukprot:SAG31_NODE_92_length_26360_cov_29.601881_4_plen_31_part_00
MLLMSVIKVLLAATDDQCDIIGDEELEEVG